MTGIVVVGGVNMDLHLFGARRESSGSTLIVDRYLTEPGGKGGNVARAAARLGAEVRLVGRVGDDEFGHQSVDVIRSDGVDVSAISFSSTTPTGFVAIELDGGLHRTLMFAPGANDELTWDDHVRPAMRGLGSGDIVITQAEIPTAVLTELARYVAHRRAHLYLDPTPPEEVGGAVLRAADVITPDRHEAAALAGRADTSELWPELAAADLRRTGARTVVIKTGASGAVLVDDTGTCRVPTLRVEPQDETGAGDVFLAALAVRRSEQAGWVEAVRFANAASALSVADRGLLLPERATVEAALPMVGTPPEMVDAAPPAVDTTPQPADSAAPAVDTTPQPADSVPPAVDTTPTPTPAPASTRSRPGATDTTSIGPCRTRTQTRPR